MFIPMIQEQIGAQFLLDFIPSYVILTINDLISKYIFVSLYRCLSDGGGGGGLFMH